MIRLALFCAALLATLSVSAHEGHPPAKAANSPSPGAAELPGAMELPALEGPKPWSDKPVLNDPRRFQIAICTDRTGGHRPGVWMDAMRKLNLLRPEFVVSVGDLIEGYTEDEAQVEREWEEFLGFIDELQMRFFFVAGNHDLTNTMMHRKWRDRFGPEWYSFDYRGVHFLCLCSEDPTQQHISEEQIEFVRADLAEHADARWTLVFLHKPLWTYAERMIAEGGEDRTNWTRVEELLVGRPHTVFAGHVHHYVQYERNGENYYSLATTGGGSSLRGNEYGEFDHVTWLTMEPDGPHVVNLRLDGILPPGVVTEASANRFNRFLRQATVRVAPILLEDAEGFAEGELSIELVNDFGRLVELEGAIDGLPLRGLTVSGDGRSRLAVGPTGSAVRTVRIRFDEPQPFDDLRRATFTAKLTAPKTDGEPRLVAERTIPVVIDRLYECPRRDTPPKIDGLLDGWPPRPYETSAAPLILGDSRQWQGADDGSFRLAVSHDDEFVYVQASVTDERVVEGRDELILAFDARDASTRSEDPRLRRGTFVVSVPAPGADSVGALEAGPGWRGSPIDGVAAAGRPTPGGYELEAAIPIERFNRAAGGEWDDFQMSAILVDADEPSGPVAEVVWRGSPDVRSTNANYAQFRRAE